MVEFGIVLAGDLGNNVCGRRGIGQRRRPFSLELVVSESAKHVGQAEFDEAGDHCGVVVPLAVG